MSDMYDTSLMELTIAVLTTYDCQFVIRRHKKDVLTQLPQKIRQRIPVELTARDRKTVAAMQKKLKGARQLVQAIEGGSGDDDRFKLRSEQRSLLIEAYKQIGLAKVEPSLKYILGVLETGNKLLVFAHHRFVPFLLALRLFMYWNVDCVVV